MSGVPIGTYSVTGAQPALSAEEASVVDGFHDLFYRRWTGGADTINLSWLGYRVLKCPLDLWIYQELIVHLQPEVIVETGTAYGGSALFMATMLDLIGRGEVITIDTEPGTNRPVHPRITYLTGSSTDATIVERVFTTVGNRTAMIVLDSDHHAPHVAAELEAYSTLVGPGHYLIVEDTNINGHPTLPEFGEGPMEAVTEFLLHHREFEVDRRCERFLMTLNPGGYLRRIPR